MLALGLDLHEISSLASIFLPSLSESGMNPTRTGYQLTRRHPTIIERVLCLYTSHWSYACQDDHPLQTSVSATGILMTCSCSLTVIEAGLKLPVDVDDT